MSEYRNACSSSGVEQIPTRINPSLIIDDASPSLHVSRTAEACDRISMDVVGSGSFMGVLLKGKASNEN